MSLNGTLVYAKGHGRTSELAIGKSAKESESGVGNRRQVHFDGKMADSPVASPWISPWTGFVSGGMRGPEPVATADRYKNPS